MTRIVAEPLKVGESAAFNYTFQDADGTALDITGAASPRFDITYPDGTSFSDDAELVDAVNGLVQYAHPALTMEGPHRFEFWVTLNSQPIGSPTLRAYVEAAQHVAS